MVLHPGPKMQTPDCSFGESHVLADPDGLKQVHDHVSDLPSGNLFPSGGPRSEGGPPPQLSARILRRSRKRVERPRLRETGIPVPALAGVAGSPSGPWKLASRKGEARKLAAAGLVAGSSEQA